MAFINRLFACLILTGLVLTACAPAPATTPISSQPPTPVPPASTQTYTQVPPHSTQSFTPVPLTQSFPFSTVEPRVSLPPTITPTWLVPSPISTLVPVVEAILPAMITNRDRRWGIGGDKSRAMLIGAGSLASWGVDQGFVPGQNGDLEEYQMTAKLDNGIITDNCAVFVKKICMPKYDAGGNPVTPQWSQLDTLITTDKMIGQIWSIGNEPDWNPYLSAEDYAVWYKKFYDKIKSLDPTAKIMVGGIHSPNPARITQYANVAKNIKVDYLWQDENNDLRGWTGAWRDAYKKKYGVYPQVDIWDIHLYPDDDASKAYGDRNHPQPSDLSSASRQAIKDAAYFRNYLNSIGEGDKPLWITEAGLLKSKVIDRKNPDSYFLNYWTYFLFPIMEFMRPSNEVQRIMPFGTFTYNDPYIAQHFPDAIFLMQESVNATPLSIADLNASAQAYADYINQHQDKTPPQVSAGYYDATNRTVRLSLSDVGDEKSGVVGFSWIIADDENSRDGWIDISTFQEQVDLSIPVNMYGKYLFVRAEDAAGNRSETLRILLMP